MLTDNLIKIISTQFNIEQDKITNETSFKDDLNADSLDLVELIMSLEDEYEIEIDDEDAEKIKTVGDAIDFVKDVLGEDN